MDLQPWPRPPSLAPRLSLLYPATLKIILIAILGQLNWGHIWCFKQQPCINDGTMHNEGGVITSNFMGNIQWCGVMFLAFISLVAKNQCTGGSDYLLHIRHHMLICGAACCCNLCVMRCSSWVTQYREFYKYMKIWCWFCRHDKQSWSSTVLSSFLKRCGTCFVIPTKKAFPTPQNQKHLYWFQVQC